MAPIPFNYQTSLSLRSPVTDMNYHSEVLYDDDAKKLTIISDLYTEPEMIDQFCDTGDDVQMCMSALSYAAGLNSEGAGKGQTGMSVAVERLPLRYSDGTLSVTVSAAAQTTQPSAAPAESESYSMTSKLDDQNLLTMWTVLSDGEVTRIVVMGNECFCLRQVKDAGNDAEKAPQAPDHFVAFDAALKAGTYRLVQYPRVGPSWKSELD